MADFNADPNIMPEVRISLRDIVCGCLGRFAMLPSSSEPCLSEHHRETTGDSQGKLEFPEGFGF